LKPHFIDGYRKFVKGDDQVNTDPFFNDDSDELDNIDERTSKSNINKYFSTNKENTTINDKKIDRLDIITQAMKNEWWYDMFDVERAENDVDENQFLCSLSHRR
jgi:hypothetical protein